MTTEGLNEPEKQLLAPHAYFRSYLFTELPNATTVEHFEPLLRWNVKLVLQLPRLSLKTSPDDGSAMAWSGLPSDFRRLWLPIAATIHANSAHADYNN